MTADTSMMSNYTQAIENLPEGAFLGSLLWFSISNADVNLEQATDELARLGLRTNGLRKILRPVDAFRKASREVAAKFKVVDGVRSEMLVRAVGDDDEQAHRHIILERAVNKAGRRRRIFYEKVGEVVFTRGVKKDGEYSGYGVETRRTTMNLGEPLTDEEDTWLDARLEGFEARFDHLLHHMDSHAVRTFVRTYIDVLGGTCVKESGGLYFVAQEHAAELAKLGQWVRSVGSEFHTLPLLNLADQREMIMQALEDETVKEVERLMGEVAEILRDPERRIEERTFDAHALRAAQLRAKIDEYAGMLGDRASQAEIKLAVYQQQTLKMADRIRTPQTGRVKATTS